MPAQPNILIVDDEEIARESLKKVVQRAGYAVLVAEGGEEALKLLRDNPFHVVISDHDMPGMDGNDLLRIVATRFPQVCRILLTGRTDGDAAIRAVNVGQVYRFLTKPCRSSELLTVLHFACENFEIDAENRRLLALVRQQAELLGEIERRAPDTVSLARAAVS